MDAGWGEGFYMKGLDLNPCIDVAPLLLTGAGGKLFAEKLTFPEGGKQQPASQPLLFLPRTEGVIKPKAAPK